MRTGTCLTDQYQQTATTDTTNISPGDPVSLVSGNGNNATSNPAYFNTDQTPNLGTIRFRHNRNTVANALMVDGHVENYNYNPKNQTTDLLRKNINVNQ